MTETVTGDIPVKASLWRILVDPLPVIEKVGSIELTEDTKRMQEYRRYVGQVIDVGPLAYMGDRFMDENGNKRPGCKVGDWIIYGRNNGIDVYVNEGDDKVRQLKLINDDQVLGVVEDSSCIDVQL